jgi:hypothetical protein
MLNYFYFFYKIKMSIPKKIKKSKKVQAYIYNRFSALMDDEEQEQKTLYDLQKLKSMRMKQLVPLAKSMNLIGISNKRKQDLCVLIANALGITNLEEPVELEETTIIMNMTIIPRKKRSMTSEKASIVKKQGHKNQDRFAKIMNGIKSDDHTGKINISSRKDIFA